MRVLWITNQATPNIARDMKDDIGFGGGWMADLSLQISSNDCIKLGIVFPVNTIEKNNITGQVDRIWYCGLFLNKAANEPKMKDVIDFERIIFLFKPDVIHIWGTEYVHSFSAIQACKNLDLLHRTVVSIQGLVSIYARHFWGYISEPLLKPTFRDIVKNSTLKKQQESFSRRGIYEIETLKIARHVIGRTDWDNACTQQINEKLKYHFCNETLRSPFYNNDWSIDQCERQSIFVSQSQYPIKGLHIVLEAMPLIIKRYPNAKVYTTGNNKVARNFKGKLKQNTYDWYIEKLIEQYHLQDNIIFTGFLDEDQMCKRFCSAHVFVSASSIENSPNSLGEAMLLGVPIVSSCVGGVKDMLVDSQEGFIYPADEPYMLAYYINKIFEDDDLAIRLSKNAKKHAKFTHDPQRNLDGLLNIYNEIREA